MAKKLKEVEIKRSRWLRAPKGGGDDYPGGRLRDGAGKQCCLGFLARACGVKAAELKGAYFPFALSSWLPSWMDKETQWACAEVNDDDRLSDSTKERKIKTLFKQAGYKAVFVD